MTGTIRQGLGVAALPCLAAVLGLGSAVAAVPAAADNAVARVTGDARVDALISQMTLDEKLTLLEGSQEAASTNQHEAGYLPGIPRLGIPSLRLSDGPPGVATRQPSVGMTGTMGVAATFSQQDA
jgi:beta-glucosidase